MSDIVYVTIAVFLFTFIIVFLYCTSGVRSVKSNPKSRGSSSKEARSDVCKHLKKGYEERIRRRMAKRE